MAHARRMLAPLRRGRMVVLCAEDRALVYARVPAEGPDVVVVLHDGAGDGVVTCDVARAALPRDAMLVGALGAAPAVRLDGTTLRARMSPRAAAIYTLRAQ